MKKILSILMILVLVGGVAFAQVEPTFTGEATLSWGIDLGKGKTGDDAKISHGFLNEASASVSLPFVKSGASKGEGDVYAYIDLSKVNLGLSADMKGAKATGKVGAVSAKIVFYGAYITLYNAPNMTTNYATRVVNGDNYATFKTGFTGYGTKIGYANKEVMDLDVGLKFVSNGSWKDRDGNIPEHFVKTVVVNGSAPEYADWVNIPAGHELRKYGVDASGSALDKVGTWHLMPNGTYELYALAKTQKDLNGKYGFGIDFHMTPVEKFLTVDANFNMTFDAKKVYQKGVNSSWNDSAVMNFGVNLKSSPLDGLNLVLGFDGGTDYRHMNASLLDADKTDGSLFAWALGFGVDYAPKNIGKFDMGVYVASDSTPYGKGSVIDPDKFDPLVNKWKKGGRGQIDMAMTFGYSGLPIVEGLDIHARVNVFRLLSKISDAAKKGGKTIPVGLNVGAAYTAKISDSMSIKPYADVWGETNVRAYEDDTAAADQKAYFGIAYKVGLEFMPMERLTIDASWMHGKLADDDNLGVGKVTPVQHKANNGKFILSAKITF